MACSERLEGEVTSMTTIKGKQLYTSAVAAIGLFALSTTFPARAQVILDMSLITCEQYLGYDPARQEMVSAWMSGYFNASINQPVVSVERFEYNKRVVTDYCREHRRETLMSAIRQSVF
jgi:acid stress chaperone HdeB